jgi:putative transposase
MVVRKRLKITGRALVFVTTAVTDWLPIFSNEVLAHTVLAQLRETSNHFGVSLVGYVLMPSHLHALLGFPHVELLSKFMQSVKILSAKRIKELDLGIYRDRLRVNGEFRLWRPRFDDLLISSEKQLKIKLDYIHNNPVKAGLVTHAGDWKYSSASDWLDNCPGIIKVDKEFSWMV